MPKRNWTDEERKAFADKMKAARTKTKVKPLKQKESSTELSYQEKLLETLIQAVTTLQSERTGSPQPEAGVRVNHAGEITGIINKYPIEEDFYPDPTDELKKMPELRRFGFEDNYYLEWKVISQPYQTANNVWYNEPWHVLTVLARRYDDDGNPMYNEGGDERVILWRTGYFFEDETMIAQYVNSKGLTEYDPNQLANQIRMERMKRWLRDCFMPQKPKNIDSDKQVVVNGQVVIETLRFKQLDELPEKSSIRI